MELSAYVGDDYEAMVAQLVENNGTQQVESALGATFSAGDLVNLRMNAETPASLSAGFEFSALQAVGMSKNGTTDVPPNIAAECRDRMVPGRRRHDRRRR